jgi:hypothetical protein
MLDRPRMTLLLITGKGGETAPDTANRDVARAQELARRIDDLVVLEADETWWTPVRARQAEISWRPEPIDWEAGARRSSLALVLRETAERESGAVVLLLDADLELVKQIHPVAQRLDLPLLWWHEEPPSEAVVAEVRQYVAGLLTSWSDHAAVPGWLWSVGAGIDLQVAEPIERFPVRPPLRLLVWAPTRSADLKGVLQTLALARGLNANAHLTIALIDGITAHAQRLVIEAQIRNLALTQSVDIAVVEGPRDFPRMLTKGHALVDVEGPGGALGLEALLAMAHGRPVVSSRKEFAELLDIAPLPLRFAPGDKGQFADRIKSLAAAWGEELDSAGQMLRNAVRQEHSVVHWAEAVDSIVGFVRLQSGAANEAGAREPSSASVAFSENGSAAPTPSLERPGPDGRQEALDGEGSAEVPTETSSDDVTLHSSRWRRRRSPRSGNR